MSREVNKSTCPIFRVHYRSCHVFEYVDKSFLSEVAQTIRNRRLEIEPQGIDILANAFVFFIQKAGFIRGGEQLINYLLGQTREKVRGFSPYELINVFRALYFVGSNDRELIYSLSDACWDLRNQFSQRDLIMLAHCQAALGYRNCDLLCYIADQLQNDISKLDNRDLADILWTFVRLRLEDHKVVDQVIQELVKRDDLSDELMIRIAFSLAIMQQDDNARGYLDRVLGHENPTLTDPAKRKCNILCTLLYQNFPCRYISSGRQTTISFTQQRVFEELTKIYSDYSFRSEYQVGTYFIDIALIKEKIAIEVNGPWHYTFSQDTQENFLLGDSQIKERFLKKLGWQVIVIDFDEWNNATRKEREILLKRKVGLRLMALKWGS